MTGRPIRLPEQSCARSETDSKKARHRVVRNRVRAVAYTLAFTLSASASMYVQRHLSPPFMAFLLTLPLAVLIGFVSGRSIKPITDWINHER